MTKIILKKKYKNPKLKIPHLIMYKNFQLNYKKKNWVKI